MPGSSFRYHMARSWQVATLLSVLFASLPLIAATDSGKIPVVPKWGLFEQSFRSSMAYSNALQDATLTVVFTSPQGEKSRVYGFWDGGRTWRVRFMPRQSGRWTLKTSCSDTANLGLDNQHGEFLCSASIGPSRFHQHGPVQVARDGRHLEHVDHTPFFWLADTTWNGTRLSEPRSWQIYARTRSLQKFNVTVWSVAPGDDFEGESAVTGFPERIGVNPQYFQRLDSKLDVLSHSGILSAVVPFSEGPGSTAASLPDDQITLLTRYVVARWGAAPVVWVLRSDGKNGAERASRWIRIGRAVFSQEPHAPVLVYAGENTKVVDEFRDQDWVGLFGYQPITGVGESALKKTFAGPFSTEWTKTPARPLIPIAPIENGLGAEDNNKRFTSEDVRRAAYWGLLIAPPTGVSYGGQGVVNWDRSVQPQPGETIAATLPLWEKALFMPAAKQLACMQELVESVDFWRLRPDPELVAVQPGSADPAHYIAAAATETKDLAVIYVPQDRSVELNLEHMPTAPQVSWFNPRTGEHNPAVAVVGGRTCQFPTPAPGDWVLVIKAGK